MTDDALLAPVLSAAPLFEPLPLSRGPTLKNRLVLAPLTNTQSNADGRLSDDEYRWLTMRAKGGFGMTMTCAAHVQAVGQGYPGQLGVFSDDHLPGLARLADGLKAAGSVACLQLAHSGNRALKGFARVGPSDDAESGTRGLSEAEVEALVEDFVAAALRAQAAGFDGVEIHAAHGFLPTQFLSSATNHRTDRWGGALENRARLIFAIVEGVRQACRPDFQLGLRLSPERFGLRLAEVLEVVQEAMWSGKVDTLDLSLWDVTKEAEEEAFRGRSLMSWFTDLDRGNVRIGVAGKIMGAQDALNCLANGADYVLIGRAAILAHDFPTKVAADAAYASPALPVSADFLRVEGLGEAFVDYMRAFPGFVFDEAAVREASK
jgi:2,4-dienoyl-CoA reductase-like NADH-dependent reductase (Old Yellow Enzyme family)